MLPNNLYAPVPGDQGARGLFSDRALSGSPQVWAITHRRSTAAIGAALGAAAAGIAVVALRRR